MSLNPGFVDSYAISTGMLIDGGSTGNAIKAATRAGGTGDLTFYVDKFFATGAVPSLSNVLPYIPPLGGNFDGVTVVASIANKVPDLSMCLGDNAGAGVAYYVNMTRGLSIHLPDTTSKAPTHLAQYSNDTYYIDDADGGTYHLHYIDLNTSIVTDLGTVAYPAGTGTDNLIWIYATANFLWVYVYNWSTTNLASIYKYDRASNTLVTSWTGIASCGDSGGLVPSFDIIDETRDIAQLYAGTDQNVIRITAGTPVAINATPVDATPDGWFVAQYTDGLYFMLLADNLTTPTDATELWGSITKNSTTARLDAVVAGICQDCGLAVGDYDVSLLAGTVVRGYLATRQSSGRELIAPLQEAFFFDVVESDGILKFIPRGQSSIVTLTDDDLAATLGGDKPDLITTVRKQEFEMPEKMTVSFYNLDADYQQGSQYSERQTTSSVNSLSTQLPIVLTDAEAAAIADILLYNDWQQRESHTLCLSRKYAYLDPCDVITIQSAFIGATFEFRILDSQYDPSKTVEITAADEDTAIYSSPAVGAVAAPVTQTILPIGLTTLALLDLPCMIASDNSSGFYIAGEGEGAGWSAAAVNKSTDGGSSWFGVGFVYGGVVGTTTTALATGDLSNTRDLSSSVNVQMHRSTDTLSSVTDLQLYNGANACAVGSTATGWEILQFATATLEMDGSYTITDMLRCRKGSDGTRPASFPPGTTFVILSSANVQRFAQPFTDIGQTRDYEAISTGDSHGVPVDYSFTFAANSLQPYAPCGLGGWRDASNNLTITWTRRDRLDNDWRDLVDVPMSETTEAYEVDILSAPGGTVLRTLTSTGQEVAYSAADQTTDFGSPQASVAIAAYQMSATVARGFAGTGEV